jgi:2-polyprenyl-3-methyl-5-hydroxy-6-metoxy-1,4-benzoquinol methylase
MKSKFFLPADCSAIKYVGNWMSSSLPHTRLTCGSGGEYVEISGQFSDLYAVFHLHQWSGTARVEVNERITKELDLFSSYPYDERLLLYSNTETRPARVRIVATGRRNALSLATEIVFRGFDFLNIPFPRTDLNVFTKMQASQVDRWSALQCDSGATQQDRIRRYVQRYLRASVFFGKRLLDIGCGYVPPEILDMLALRGTEYDGLDIDSRVVEYMNNQLRQRNIRGLIRCGEIGSIELSGNAYDTIFSSHTLEHSSSLAHSLKQIFRALKPTSYLIMAVPIGWDDSEEHMVCYTVGEWVMALAHEKLDVVSVEVGRLYDPSRYDVTIVAQKPSC